MSLATGDLTTLASAKAYVPGPPSDAILQRLIPAVSRTILGALNRNSIVPQQFTLQLNGSGTQGLVLPDWPVLDSPLMTLVVGGAAYPLAGQESETNIIAAPFGFRYQPWNGVPPGDPAVVELTGGAWFGFGNQNVVVTYDAGYQISSEAMVVPATPFQATPQTPYGIWASDRGVSYASTGAPLTAVASPAVPTLGQYLPPDPNLATPRLYYTFAAADAGASLLISYGFVPFDVEQVALDLIAERAAYRGRIGVKSQSIASQESVTFDTSGLTSYIQRVLNAYMSVLPPATGASV